MKISKIPVVSSEEAYQMGRNCAINGPNVVICHFAIFKCVENTSAWERGKRGLRRGTRNEDDTRADQGQPGDAR